MIAVDWGTSSLRAYRLGPGGEVLEQRSRSVELRTVGGAFEALLAEQLAGWPDRTILMAGMIGSRNGWHEVPYVPCPAGADEIAAGMLRVDAPSSFGGRQILVAPGLRHEATGAAPEVMRGEETQLVGLLDELEADAPHVVCLPGTHSKWVQVDAGRVRAFRTAMTGELYAVLRRHSLLGALMPADAAQDADDADAFARGVDASGGDGGLPNHLFGVRTRGLFGQLATEAAPSFLSGLLIGHELRALLPPGTPRVHLIGSSGLVRRYERALDRLGSRAQLHDEALSVRGLLRLARARGLEA